jgi:hypothetical protein
VPFGEQVVVIAALGGVHAVEGEVIEDEQIDGEELAELGFTAVVESGMFQSSASGPLGGPGWSARVDSRRGRARGEDGLADAID